MSHGAPSPSANPILVEVTRGQVVESRHRGAAAIVRLDGTVVESWGDIEASVYPRSALKPFQALPLIETGAAEAFAVTEAEIALACASHTGESVHVEAVRAWLDRLDLSAADLACGGHFSTHAVVAQEQVMAGVRDPDATFNNCSGKHTGFLTVAKHTGVPLRGYHQAHHPIQQRVLGVLEFMAGLNLSGDPLPCAVDGCSAPIWAVPLGNLALAWARLAAPEDLPPARALAARQILSAMAAHPYLVAGRDRACTKIIEACQGEAVVKVGAEGVYCAALPAHGLGIALKIDDGAARAAEAVLAALLLRAGLDHGTTVLETLVRQEIFSWRGEKVGVLSATQTIIP
ncbi:MAG: asparaginase [Magnetospiraceae bacterium]